MSENRNGDGKAEEADKNGGEGTLGDMSVSDLMMEMRVLLPSAQVLSAFLVLLPFSSGFNKINDYERGVFVLAFFCAVVSLVFFSAPAVHHRIMRPVRDRASFKDWSSVMAVIGMVPHSLAWVLTAYLVVEHVMGQLWGGAVSGCLALVILVIWWAYPYARKNQV